MKDEPSRRDVISAAVGGAAIAAEAAVDAVSGRAQAQPEKAKDLLPEVNMRLGQDFLKEIDEVVSRTEGDITQAESAIRESIVQSNALEDTLGFHKNRLMINHAQISLFINVLVLNKEEQRYDSLRPLILKLQNTKERLEDLILKKPLGNE